MLTLNVRFHVLFLFLSFSFLFSTLHAYNKFSMFLLYFLCFLFPYSSSSSPNHAFVLLHTPTSVVAKIITST